MHTDMTSEKATFLRNGKLDFLVSKEKLYTEGFDENLPTPFYTTMRNDNELPLGCVTDRYVVKQNYELLDIVLNKIGDEQYDLSDSKCGAFKGGRKVFFFIKIKSKVDFGQEMADTYVYAVSSHDGSTRLAFGISTKLHSCSNMFSLLMADKDNQHIIKHTKRIEGITEYNKLDELIQRNTTGLSTIMKKMSKTLPPNNFIDKVLDLVGRVDGQRVMASTLSKREALLSSISSETEEKGYTYYGLFNGITHYLTHKVRESNTDEWFDYNLNGQGAKITSDALKMIVNQMKEDGLWAN